MKRIEAFIQSDKQQEVVEALSKLKIGGLTVIQCLGRGAGERPRIGGEQGGAIPYNTIDIIVTYVDDPIVDEVMTAISSAAYTGTKGDGKIFVSTVDDGMDICTKEKGTKSL
jgi:nitrogen regulatory protein P-II 1